MVKTFLKSELGEAAIPVSALANAEEFSLIGYYPQLFPSAAPRFAWVVFQRCITQKNCPPPANGCAACVVHAQPFVLK
jgi:hypothetical protein